MQPKKALKVFQISITTNNVETALLQDVTSTLFANSSLSFPYPFFGNDSTIGLAEKHSLNDIKSKYRCTGKRISTVLLLSHCRKLKQTQASARQTKHHHQPTHRRHAPGCCR